LSGAHGPYSDVRMLHSGTGPARHGYHHVGIRLRLLGSGIGAVSNERVRIANMRDVSVRLILLVTLAMASSLAPAGCGDDDDDTGTGDGDADSDGDGDGDSDADGDADTDGDSDGDADSDADSDGDGDGDADVAPCTPGNTQCTDCIDNDGDGFTDGFDPHCTGAADNDESSFATGIPGDNRDYRWQDCFFDGNSGGGNDCRYHVCCILAECPADEIDSFNPDTDCPITQECIDHCFDLTTNGCDCFGCCTICNGNDCHTVITNPAIAPNCDVDVLDDPDLCPACNQNDECGSPCDPANCILCPGQTMDDLPPECQGGGEEPPPDQPQNQCPEGRTPCVTSDQCPVDYYCSVGCCILSGPF